MNSSPSSQSTSATLRPRIRRLISLEDGSDPAGRSLSPTPSEGDGPASFSSSRAPSPIPSAHPSRATSAHRTPQKAQSQATSNPTGRSRGFQAPSTGTKSSLFTPGYWETSWSSIQGIASTLLGSDSGDAQKSKAVPQRRASVSRTPRFNLSTVAEQWGPAAGSERHIAVGSQEDRLARLQAKKREALLMANGHTNSDTLGKFKRRDSIGIETAQPLEDDLSDALVYLHHVQPEDTLAGLSIKYNCTQAVLRKANRLWPNDSIQLRKLAFLPVDACAVKGRKVASPTPTPTISASPVDLLRDPTAFEDPSITPTLAHPDWAIPSPKHASNPSFSSTTLSTTTDTSHDPENQHWTHDSWVNIDHILHPVEIARLPRRDLSFFPPARRKSISYTDNTPPPRSPLLRASTIGELSPPNDNNNQNQNNRRHTHSPSGTPATSAPTSSAAANFFARTLIGPGGVGTLDHKARSPGPGRDKLNTLFEATIPAAVSAAMSGSNGHGGGGGGGKGGSSTLGVGGLLAPRASFDSVASGSSNATAGGIATELGGRVEGWVRKMAVVGAGSKVTGGAGGLMAGGSDGVARGDEIELDEDMMGSGFLGGSSRSGNGNGNRNGNVDGASGAGLLRGEALLSAAKSSSRDEEERLLAERFPIRGRVFEERNKRR